MLCTSQKEGLRAPASMGLTGTSFIENTASQDGGGIWSDGSLNVTGATLAGNAANRDGGGLWTGTLSGSYIGSSGIDFYQGSLYPGWQSSLLVAGLRQPRISRLQLEGNAVGAETVLLANLGLRVRDVQLGPDGLVYALAGGSRLIRLEPTSP